MVKTPQRPISRVYAMIRRDLSNYSRKSAAMPKRKLRNRKTRRVVKGKAMMVPRVRRGRS